VRLDPGRSPFVDIGTAPGVQAAKRFSVSIAVSKSRIALASSITISSKVSPNASEQTVTIPKKLPGGNKGKTEKKRFGQLRRDRSGVERSDSWDQFARLSWTRECQGQAELRCYPPRIGALRRL